MNRRSFLATATAAAIAPMAPAISSVAETYSTCPAGFALRCWVGEDGRTYKMVVPLPRYVEGGVCRWTEYAKQQAA